MDKPKLEDLLKQIENKEIKRSHPYAAEIWYNKSGDCIEFQTEDVAIVADRIDDFLTIYRSEAGDLPIGFQLKDAKALMQRLNCQLNIVTATVLNNQLMEVASMLIKAYDQKPVTIRKEEGYKEALKNLMEKAAAA